MFYFIDVTISSTHIFNSCVIGNSLLLWNVCHLVESNFLSLTIRLWTFSNFVDSLMQSLIDLSNNMPNFKQRFGSEKLKMLFIFFIVYIVVVTPLPVVWCEFEWIDNPELKLKTNTHTCRWVQPEISSH